MSATPSRPRRSTLNSIVHLGFHVEDDDDEGVAAAVAPRREIDQNTGISFYVPRRLKTSTQALLLFNGAKKDIKERNIFSPYPSDRILMYFDGVVSLVSVFLFEEGPMGWQEILDIRNNPTPVLLSLLCFFHILVYWVEVHHFLKFSPNVMSLPQVWCIMLFSLGMVMYPLSLEAWIEQGDVGSSSYYYINTGMCFIFGVLTWSSPIDKSANHLYCLWQRLAAVVAVVFYSIASILHWQGFDWSRYMLYIAPFCFVCPCGAKTNYQEGKRNENLGVFASPIKAKYLWGAIEDIKHWNILPLYSMEMVLDYFDSVVGLAAVLLFIDLGWEDTISSTNSYNGLLAALLCFFQVLGHWINLHHWQKFAPKQKMTILQLWCIVIMALTMIFYPLSISAWFFGGEIDVYYITNIAVCVFSMLLSFLSQIERGRSNRLYRLWHKVAPILGVVWYSIAYILFKIGKEQQWMIIVAPFCYMFPLGGEKKRQRNSENNNNNPSPAEKDDDDDISKVDDWRDSNRSAEVFFDCPDPDEPDQTVMDYGLHNSEWSTTPSVQRKL